MQNQTPTAIRPPGFDRIEPHIRRRRAAGLSQAELSAAMGVHPSNVSRAERGRQPITEEFAERYRDALDRCLAHLEAGDAHASRARALHDADGRIPRPVRIGDLFDGGDDA